MSFYNHRLHILLSTLLILSFASVMLGQVEDPFGDQAADPIKLFERGQSFHARGEYSRALAFYEQAIKVRPEFPEAEFQRGNALISLNRFEEGEQALRRAIELRSEWSLPFTALGGLLLRLERDNEAETALRQALKLNQDDVVAARLLADVRLRAGDAHEALELARQATEANEAPVSAWLVRALAERANDDLAGAKISLERVLRTDPDNISALVERSDLQLKAGNYESAIADLKRAYQLQPDDKQIASRLASAYDKAGDPVEAQRVAKAAGLLTEEPASSDGSIKVVGTPEEIEAANSDDPLIARKALAQLLEKNPDNPDLFAKLGASYRTDDPVRSLEYYHKALTIQPDNADFAVGYASALIKTRRFEEAVVILRRVIKIAPDNYVAHSNLATALFSLQYYEQALAEYEWLLNARPDLPVIHYFIAIAHDKLGEYQDALKAYETFLAQAETSTNQLEIEKVKLRLPTLRRQVQLKEGVKRRRH